MGWVELPAYFCVASETARDVATWYAERPMGDNPPHKFLKHTMDGEGVAQLPPTSDNTAFQYFIDVYVDDFIPLAMATSQQQLAHVASAVMQGIHDVFPAHQEAEQDPISFQKLAKGDGQWALNKALLGFVFDGAPGNKTMHLEPSKREFLLVILHKWL
jgi:hypothetical protein